MTPLVRLWIWISAFASLAGWTLSALGQLNRPGYLAAFGVFAVFLCWRRRDLGFAPGRRLFPAGKLRRRFLRRWPLCFAALALLIFLGGVLYPPDNYTGLTYRVGRVLQWLSHEQWFWINTADYRMNNRACGIEWLSAPLLLLTGSTRGLFLLNFLPYLLLPGLIYSVFTRLGVRPRVAWHWMWLFPTAYNFLLQAGGIANDTFPAVYALAAIDFGLRAWQSRRLSDLWHSGLALALLTGAKASNLTLLLPWAIVVLPLLPLLRRNMVVTALLMFLAVVISFLPNALLNIHYLGDWSGLSIERTGMDMKTPVVGIWGNTFLLLLGNFTPTFFPLAGWWNEHALTVLPQFITGPMMANFEPGFLWLGELPTEDWSGIGFGISVLLTVSIIAGSWKKRNAPLLAAERKEIISSAFLKIVLLAPWISLLAYCVKSGMVTPGRLIAPYYALLFPLLLVGAGQTQVVRRWWWQALAGVVVLMAFVVLVLLPDRPLWPAQKVLAQLVEKHPDTRLLSRALNVYQVYSWRHDPLANVRELLPPGIPVVGFIGAEDDCDISFWLPLGSRKVEHFLHTDPPERIVETGVEYVVVGDLNLKLRGLTFEDWRQKTGAELIASTNATQKVSEGPQPWYLVRFGTNH
jgi:hypothetical protein